MKFSKLYLGVIAVCVMLTSCTSVKSGPDLAEIYNRSAQAHPIDRNPVILIPGIKGSRLMNSDSGELVWGAFGGGSLDPNTAEGARLFSLPMKKGVALNDLKDTVIADGVLDQAKVSLFGLSFELSAYLNIMNVLGAGQYFDRMMNKDSTVDYGARHFTCFQFAYDWRLSLDDNAQKLDEFIKETRVYVQDEIEEYHGIENYDVKFDLIAHSMGGLLSRYYLRYGGSQVESIDASAPVPWAGAEHVEKLVMVGTPNAGSLDSVINFIDGMVIGPFLPTFNSTIVGTIPAVYQLLPRNRHHRIVSAEHPDGEVLDIYDPKVWIKYGWSLAATDNDEMLQRLLPSISTASERRVIALDHLDKSLQKADAIAVALDRPASPPDNVGLYLFSGDAIRTPSLLAIDAHGDYEVVEHEFGDGIVVRSSTLLDERIGQEWHPNLQSPIDWKTISFIFKDHLGLTKDPSFSDNLLFLLLER